MPFEICVHHRSYYLEPFDHESDQQVARRLWTIIHYRPEDDLSFQRADQKSRIKYAQDYLGCQYPEPKNER